MLEKNCVSCNIVDRTYIHTHSKLYNILLVATKLHVILKEFGMVTWMHDKKN